jgi:hypothetical protein
MLHASTASNLFGVGHDPDPLTLVSCSNIASREHSPSRIEPHRGQVSENNVKPPRSEHWRVLHEDVSGSNFANDPGHLHPESAALTREPCAFACRADVLTGEPAADDIDTSAPWVPVEGSHVVPDREAREDAVSLSGEEDSTGVGSKLNSADGAPSKELASQDAASCPCK